MQDIDLEGLAHHVAMLNASVHVLLRACASRETHGVLAVKLAEYEADVIASGAQEATLQLVQSLHATLLAAARRPS